ncbi:DNA invertase Pin-like site-specific DNA recombinase [Bradyrhizobium embrapense]
MAPLGYARVSTQDRQLTGQLEALQAAGADTIYREKINGAAPVASNWRSSWPL